MAWVAPAIGVAGSLLGGKGANKAASSQDAALQSEAALNNMKLGVAKQASSYLDYLTQLHSGAQGIPAVNTPAWATNPDQPFTPQQTAAMQGISNLNLSQMMSNQAGSLNAANARRGLTGSSIQPSQMQGLQNWYLKNKAQEQQNLVMQQYQASQAAKSQLLGAVTGAQTSNTQVAGQYGQMAQAGAQGAGALGGSLANLFSALAKPQTAQAPQIPAVNTGSWNAGGNAPSNVLSTPPSFA